MITFFDDIDHVERFAAPVFELYDVYAGESIRLGIDLDEQVTDAVFASGWGEPLGNVLGFARDEDRFGNKVTHPHPAAKRARGELEKLYRDFRGSSLAA